MTNLALKYRPKTLSEIIGQTPLLGENGVLGKLIRANTLPHIFLYASSSPFILYIFILFVLPIFGRYSVTS